MVKNKIRLPQFQTLDSGDWRIIFDYLYIDEVKDGGMSYILKKDQ